MIIAVAGKGTLSISKIFGDILQRAAAHGKAQHQQVVGVSHRDRHAGASHARAALCQSFVGDRRNGEILRRVVIRLVVGHSVTADDLTHIGIIVIIAPIVRHIYGCRAQAAQRHAAAGDQAHIAAIHRSNMPRLQCLHLYGYRIDQIISADDPTNNTAEMRRTCACSSSRINRAGSLIDAELTARQPHICISQLQPVHRAAVGHIYKSTVARVAHICIAGQRDNGSVVRAHNDPVERILLRADTRKLHIR